MASGAAGVTIIKRKKIISGGGHHGGAWKVANADFVTAMMAFFLLMWLLNATTEKQRKGIADYFSPTIPISKLSGGGNGAFGGNSGFAEESQAQNGTGATQERQAAENQARGATGTVTLEKTDEKTDDDTSLASVESVLNGTSGESAINDDLLQHIRTRVTDEGLIVELFDLEDSSLFLPGTAEPADKMLALLEMLANAFNLVTNPIAVAGHTSSLPIVVKINPNWELSSARAQKTRVLLMDLGISELRFERITGKADRDLAAEDPMAARNRRIELTLLRSDRVEK